MEEQKEKQPWWQPALILSARFSAWIFGPVIIALFLGKWLDKKFDTQPILFLVTVGSAFLLSMIGLVIEVSKEYKKIGVDSDKSNIKNKK